MLKQTALPQLAITSELITLSLCTFNFLVAAFVSLQRLIHFIRNTLLL
jgi:hypothetical protein